MTTRIILNVPQEKLSKWRLLVQSHSLRPLLLLLISCNLWRLCHGWLRSLLNYSDLLSVWVLRVRGSVFPLFQILSIALSPSSKNKSESKPNPHANFPLLPYHFSFPWHKRFCKSVHTVSIFSCLKLYDKDLLMTSNLTGKCKGIFKFSFLIDCLLCSQFLCHAFHFALSSVPKNPFI